MVAANPSFAAETIYHFETNLQSIFFFSIGHLYLSFQPVESFFLRERSIKYSPICFGKVLTLGVLPAMSAHPLFRAQINEAG